MNNIREGIESIPFQNNSKIKLSDNKDSFSARVIFVLLDDSDPYKFQKYGGTTGIGTIECERIIGNNIYKTNIITARPLDSNFRRYPLVGEIVKIEKAPSFFNQSYRNQYEESYYYSDIIGTWDTVEHNITPFSDDLRRSNTNKTDRYISSKNGILESENNNGNNFIQDIKESGNIKRLQPLPGDISIQGRFGNSIRFSSSNIRNNSSPWNGEDGKPVLIIRNGQSNEVDNDIIYEDVNNDGSSIYMIDGHKLNINLSSNNFKTLTEYKSELNKIAQPDFSTSSADLINESSDNIKKEIDKVESSASNNIDYQDDISYLPDYEENLVFTNIYDSFNGYISRYLDDPIPERKVLNRPSGNKKSSYKDLPYKNSVKKTYTKNEIVSFINSYLKDFSLPIKKAVYIVKYIENGGSFFNFNGWGVQTDGAIWIDPENAITHQLYLKETKTGNNRSFAGFDDMKSAMRFVAYAFERKNISISNPDIVKTYIKTWIGVGNINTSTVKTLVDQLNSEANIYFK